MVVNVLLTCQGTANGIKCSDAPHQFFFIIPNKQHRFSGKFRQKKKAKMKKSISGNRSSSILRDLNINMLISKAGLMCSVKRVASSCWT